MDKIEDLGISAVALESLEKDFHMVMKDLGAEDNLERFRLEYEKLHRALKKSHESEKRLIKKCQELNQEIMANAAKVQVSLKLSHEDQNTISQLKKEIEKTWKMVDGAHEKEARAKDTIQQLKKEVNQLTQLVEQGAGLTVGQENNLQDLIEHKKELTKERDTLSQKIVGQTHELRELTERAKKLDAEAAARDLDLHQKNDAYNALIKDHDIEFRRKEVNETKVKELNAAIQARVQNADKLKIEAKQKADALDLIEKQIKEERDKVRELYLKNEKVKRDLEAQTKAMDEELTLTAQYAKQITQLKAEVDTKQAEVEHETGALQRLQQACTLQDRQFDKLIKDKEDVVKQSSEIQKHIGELSKKLDGQRKLLEEAERDVKDQEREKNLLITKVVREETRRVELIGESMVEAGKIKNLEQEQEAHIKENHLNRKKVYELEKQREKYHAMATEATGKYNQALEEVKLGNQRIDEFQKRIEDAEQKLKKQQGMYEQVRSDRNLYSKNCIEAQEEITEMKRKFKIMDHQIDQLKEELSLKERKLCEAHSSHKSISEEYSRAEKKVKHLQNDYDLAKSRGESLAQEIKELTQIIADCDTEKAKQLMKYNSVTNERNILGTQLIRRNEELTILYEKIRIQHSTLAKGESQYRDRLVDIRLLRSKIQELRGGLRVSQARVRNIQELKKDITTLQRALIAERAKVKALSEDLGNPMNVHRWRKLEGSNPREYENIQKIQTLQKRLIAKTEECSQKDSHIGEMEKRYVELKNVLSRQPGPEVAEQLNVYHENLQQRTTQMKKLSSELDTTQTQTTEYRVDIERLQKELLDVKKKYFELKTKNQLLSRARAAAQTGAQAEDTHTLQVRHAVNQPRCTGGGFALTR